jgi:hypothetical protein
MEKLEVGWDWTGSWECPRNATTLRHTERAAHFYPFSVRKMSFLEYVQGLGLIDNALSIIVSLGGLAGASAMGKMPKLGPGRALVLAARSMFGRLEVRTARTTMISRLQDKLANASPSVYFVLHGPKAVGKTTLTNTLVHRRPGVTRVDIGAGESKETITDKSLRAITNMHLTFTSPISNARRVLFCYRCIPFLPKPLLVLHASERSKDEPYAKLTAAVRELTENFGVQVLVDGSENSLEPELFATTREKPVAVEPFLVEELEQFPEFTSFFKHLELTGDRELSAAVRYIAGGIPTSYQKINESVLEGKPEDFAAIVKTFLLSMLADQRVIVREMCIRCAAAGALYDQFSEVDHLIFDAQVRPSPDKVLRVVRIGTKLHLVPSTPQMAFFLRHKRDLVMEGSEEEEWQEVVRAVRADEQGGTRQTGARCRGQGGVRQGGARRRGVRPGARVRHRRGGYVRGAARQQQEVTGVLSHHRRLL